MRTVVVAAMVLGLAASARAQTPSRTPWGDPDLQGLWNNATVAPMERPAMLAKKPFWTEAEAVDVEKNGMQTLLKAVAPEVAVSGELNEIWLEAGKVLRNRNTSMVIDPPDGQNPVHARGQETVGRPADAREEADRRRSRGARADRTVHPGRSGSSAKSFL